jgi:transposase
MQVLYDRCAGMDVHKKSVTVCLITPDRTSGITKRFLGELESGARTRRNNKGWLVSTLDNHQNRTIINSLDMK